MNTEFLELCEHFNIVILTTAAESPWSNGLCERHNAVLADMLDKVIEEKQCASEIALCRVIHAKNSLSNVHGISPYQIAIGFTPKMSSVLADSPPALKESTNKIVSKNLEAIAATRKAFIESVSREKVKRALKHNLRTSNDQNYVTGDVVFYKRNDSKKWKGPAKVLGTDSQQVLLKHGGIYVRVHKCRLMLKQDSENGNVDEKIADEDRREGRDEDKKKEDEDEEDEDEAESTELLLEATGSSAIWVR